jgi:DHA1 family tetracycline resistance protein-like MFS transporter
MIGAAFFGMRFHHWPCHWWDFLGSFGPEAPFLAAATLALLNWLYGLFILPESLRPERNRRELDWKRANPVGTLLQLRKYPVSQQSAEFSMILLNIAAWAVQGGWSYYTMLQFNWDEKMVGVSLSVVGIMAAIVSGGLIRVIVPKLGQVRGVYIGLALSVWDSYFHCRQHLDAVCRHGSLCTGSNSRSVAARTDFHAGSSQRSGRTAGRTGQSSECRCCGAPFMTSIFSYFTSGNAPVYFPGAAMLTGAVLAFASALWAFIVLEKTH